MKNIVYFFYFIKTSNWPRLKKHTNYVCSQFNIGKTKLIQDIVKSSLKYGIAFHEYFYYGFWQKNDKQRSEYASMGFMYRYQKKMNPIDKRDVLADKNKFDKAYAEFIRRDMMNPISSSIDDVKKFLEGRNKVVLKSSTGGGGKNVEIIKLDANITPQSIQDEAISRKFDIMEEFVQQHEDLQRLSPNSLNTVRFITQLKNDGTVDIIGSSLRMGVYKNTDNASSGGIICKINIETGKLESNAYSFEINNPLYEAHPVSGIKLIGFQVPHWEAVKEMCFKAAAKYPDNKCVGWDVAIKQDGPLLIEGNHDWGARVWQMPAGKGMRKVLEQYL